MSVASLAELKEELSFTADLGAVDDALLARHLSAAQEMIEQSLGFRLEEEYPVAGTRPAALKQAVLWLAADFYEGRGQPAGGEALPVHVEMIVTAFREWSF